jgi:hypothetical protein
LPRAASRAFAAVETALGQAMAQNLRRPARLNGQALTAPPGVNHIPNFFAFYVFTTEATT